MSSLEQSISRACDALTSDWLPCRVRDAFGSLLEELGATRKERGMWVPVLDRRHYQLCRSLELADLAAEALVLRHPIKNSDGVVSIDDAIRHLEWRGRSASV